MFGLPVTVVDSFVAGDGFLQARIAGTLPVATGTGPAFDKGELQRYLSELPVHPDAILNNGQLSWRQLSENTVEATGSSNSGTASVQCSSSSTQWAASPGCWRQTVRWRWAARQCRRLGRASIAPTSSSATSASPALGRSAGCFLRTSSLLAWRNYFIRGVANSRTASRRPLILRLNTENRRWRSWPARALLQHRMTASQIGDATSLGTKKGVHATPPF
jgi:hypothetical protein